MTPLRRHLRNAIYTVQRDYGVPIELFTVDSETFNVETGRTEETKLRLYVRRALVFDYKEDTNFTYSIQYIRANSNFAQGGFYQLRDRIVCITNKDLGAFQVNESSYVVYADIRYNVVTMQKNEEEGALILKVRQIQGQKPLRQVALTIGNSTRVESELEGT